MYWIYSYIFLFSWIWQTSYVSVQAHLGICHVKHSVVAFCLVIYIYMEMNNGKESDSIGNIEKQSYPKVMNLLRRKVNISMKLHQDFKMVKQMLIDQRWMFKTFQDRLPFVIDSSMLDYLVFQFLSLSLSLSLFTHAHTHTYIYIYVRVCAHCIKVIIEGNWHCDRSFNPGWTFLYFP